ncbi:hypothetical protein C9I92_06895 [Photobacterium ganghwense]|uniref:Uncharacterized protein n=1 Tax=Photobacterium ganghwense TaxID=320778 RepID=A0A0J1HE12_9GAMM|nr:hypothetical protein ABT57_09320 [Photobacterium ganghwense]PSU09287.1 hypothetical protein C9I92_06895 [Photobacterium ganghwense]
MRAAGKKGKGLFNGRWLVLEHKETSCTKRIRPVCGTNFPKECGIRVMIRPRVGNLIDDKMNRMFFYRGKRFRGIDPHESNAINGNAECPTVSNKNAPFQLGRFLLWQAIGRNCRGRIDSGGSPDYLCHLYNL